jgi:hypothetical protein
MNESLLLFLGYLGGMMVSAAIVFHFAPPEDDDERLMFTFVVCVWPVFWGFQAVLFANFVVRDAVERFQEWRRS